MQEQLIFASLNRFRFWSLKKERDDRAYYECQIRNEGRHVRCMGATPALAAQRAIDEMTMKNAPKKLKLRF